MPRFSSAAARFAGNWIVLTYFWRPSGASRHATVGCRGEVSWDEMLGHPVRLARRHPVRSGPVREGAVKKCVARERSVRQSALRQGAACQAPEVHPAGSGDATEDVERTLRSRVLELVPSEMFPWTPRASSVRGSPYTAQRQNQNIGEASIPEKTLSASSFRALQNRSPFLRGG